MGRLRLLVLALCAAWCAAPAAAGADPVALGPAAGPPPIAKPAIVNGAELQIASVPWQVHVLAATATRTFQCGGSILSDRWIATAAHCVYNPDTGALFAADQITVQAGVSHATTPEPGDVRQQRVAVLVRPHPYYVFDPASRGVAPDDVAVLELNPPLILDGTKRAIGLTTSGPLVAAGTGAYISGYGRQVAGGTPNGNLYGLDTVVADPLQCGSTATALVICVQSPTGSACEGDSGGPLTVGGLLTGVASFVTLNGPTGECGIGSTNGYTNVAAPEIAEFLRGNPAPPRAPRGGTDVSARGVFQVGQAMTCSPGTWSENPAFTFTFLDTRDGAQLQSGPSSTYTFAAGDVGRTVACAVTAAAAGGSGVARTQASPAIAAAPVTPPVTAPPSRPIVRVSVRALRATVSRGARVGYRIGIVNRGAVAARRVVACAVPGRGIAFLRRLPRGARRSGERACWRLGTLRPRARRTLRLTLRVSRAPARRTLVNAVSVRGANFGKRVASASVRVRGR